MWGHHARLNWSKTYHLYGFEAYIINILGTKNEIHANLGDRNNILAIQILTLSTVFL